MTSKQGKEVASAVQSVVVEVGAIFGEPGLLTRFHSDAGGEFFNAHMKQLLLEMGMFQSSTGGHNPKSNGLAERFVGIIKHKAASYLTHAELSLGFWYWAAMQAAYVYRTKVLGSPLPKNAPSFGDRVLVRDVKGERQVSQTKVKKRFSCVGRQTW